MKKKRGFILLCFVVLSFVGCVAKEVDEPCDWCHKTPSVAYTTVNDTTSYVCKDCSEMCMWCGRNKSTMHQTNMLDVEVFLCDDCYEQMQSY